MEVRAQACRDTLIQHRMVMATLFSTDCLLLQPWAEWDAGHLGIGALHIGSWNRRETRIGSMASLVKPSVCHIIE